MMTPSHVLIGCGLFARPGARARNWAAALGGLLPDLPMVLLYAYERMVLGLSEQTIWGERYSTDAWQIPVAISHSIPIYALVLAVAIVRNSDALKVYAMATLAHIACDLPLHHDDAHMHFWPFTRWKFISPVSYWDPAHYGHYASLAELAIVLAMIAVLWRRFESPRVRVALGVALAIFVAMPLYFGMVMEHG